MQHKVIAAPIETISIHLIAEILRRTGLKGLSSLSVASPRLNQAITGDLQAIQKKVTTLTPQTVLPEHYKTMGYLMADRPVPLPLYRDVGSQLLINMAHHRFINEAISAQHLAFSLSETCRDIINGKPLTGPGLKLAKEMCTHSLLGSYTFTAEELSNNLYLSRHCALPTMAIVDALGSLSKTDPSVSEFLIELDKHALDYDMTRYEYFDEVFELPGNAPLHSDIFDAFEELRQTNFNANYPNGISLPEILLRYAPHNQVLFPLSLPSVSIKRLSGPLLSLAMETHHYPAIVQILEQQVISPNICIKALESSPISTQTLQTNNITALIDWALIQFSKTNNPSKRQDIEQLCQLLIEQGASINERSIRLAVNTKCLNIIDLLITQNPSILTAYAEKSPQGANLLHMIMSERIYKQNPDKARGLIQLLSASSHLVDHHSLLLHEAIATGDSASVVVCNLIILYPHRPPKVFTDRLEEPVLQSISQQRGC